MNGRVRRARAAARLAGLLGLLLAASPAGADDLRTCMKASGDAAIAACNSGIASGRYQGKDLALLYDGRCFELYNQEHYDLAIADCSRAVELDPQNYEAVNNRGRAYAAKHDYDRAVADYSLTISLNSKYLPAFINRGLIYELREQYDRAIADFDEAIRLRPDLARGFVERGLAKQKSGDRGGAEADLAKARSLGYSP